MEEVQGEWASQASGSLLLSHEVWRLQLSLQVCIQQFSTEGWCAGPTAQATERAGTTTEWSWAILPQTLKQNGNKVDESSI